MPPENNSPPSFEGLPDQPLIYQPMPSDMMRPLSGEGPAGSEEFVSPYDYPVSSKPSNLSDYLGQYPPPPPAGTPGRRPRPPIPAVVLSVALALAVLLLASGLLIVVLRGNATPPIQLTIVEKTATATAKATQMATHPTPQHTPAASATPTALPGGTGPGPGPKPTATPAPNATATPAPATPVPPVQTFTDELNSLSYAAAHSANIKIDNASILDSDPSRAVRTSLNAEWIVWHKPNLMAFTAVTHFFTGDAMPAFSFFISADGSSWQAVSPHVATAAGTTSGWQVDTYTLQGISSANYLKIQWGTGTTNQWTPQVGRVQIMFQP